MGGIGLSWMDSPSYQHHFLADFLHLLVGDLQNGYAQPAEGFQWRHKLDIL